jgi:vacuolar-type H+-ATPase catalytic subunit A/Vma1
MKAILEFNLPDDDQEYNLANNAMNFWNVLWELDQELRANTKYAPDDMSSDTYEAYQSIRDKLHELMTDNNVSLDMVK